MRDIAEDRENRRVYIPLELLQKYDLNFLNSEPTDTETVKSMCHEFYTIAAEKYRSAFSSLPKENYKEQRPGIIMGMIYLNLLKKIKKKKFNVFDKRISLNAIEKLNAGWKGLYCYRKTYSCIFVYFFGVWCLGLPVCCLDCQLGVWIRLLGAMIWLLDVFG